MESGLQRFTDESGNKVRLTDERLRHTLRRDPEMEYQLHRFAETLANPDAVARSRSSPAFRLYYGLYPGTAGQKPLHLPRGDVGEQLLRHPHLLSRP